MVYDKGNIIEKRGLIFKDDFTPDPKGRHPAMLVLAVTPDDRYMYFLTLTSQTDKYFEGRWWQDRYFLLKKTSYNMLPKSSLINLQNIYKEPVSSERTMAYAQPQEYAKIIRKFREWQDSSPDEYYEELKPLL